MTADLKALSQDQEEKANQWMALLLADYDLSDTEKRWWNATLPEATSGDMAQIVKLHESAADICRQSLDPAMMRCVSEYWERSYGQQRPEQLLLAAFRAGLHLTESCAVELFSHVLTYIGRASYQKEHLKSHGGLVLVLIDKMEKVMSVAGWCLASGVISNEQYAYIVQRIFSEHLVDKTDLVCAIADVAVTCVVEEDLEREDELVFLKCQNLYEIIIIEDPAPAVFENDEEKKANDDGDENETIMTTANENDAVLVVVEDKKEESGAGLWESTAKGLDTKKVQAEAGRENMLHKNSDDEFGICSGGSNMGVIIKGCGCVGNGNGPVEEYQMEPKTNSLRTHHSNTLEQRGVSFSVGVGGGVGCVFLGEEDHGVANSSKESLTGKWINGGPRPCFSGSGVGVYAIFTRGYDDDDDDGEERDHESKSQYAPIELCQTPSQSGKTGIAVEIEKSMAVKGVVMPKMKMNLGVSSDPGTTRDSQAYASTLCCGVGNKLGEKARIESDKEGRELDNESHLCGCGSSSVVHYLKSHLEALLGILVVSIFGKWLSEDIFSARILKKPKEKKFIGSGVSSTLRGHQHQSYHPLLRNFAWCLLLVVACPQRLVMGQNLAGFVWESSDKSITYSTACNIGRSAHNAMSCNCAGDIGVNQPNDNPTYFRCTTGNCLGDAASHIQGLCGQCAAGQFYGTYTTDSPDDDYYLSMYDPGTCETFDAGTAQTCTCSITTYSQNPNPKVTNYYFGFVCNHALENAPWNEANNYQGAGCTECPSGTFSGEQGAQYCRPCSAGTSSNGEQGASSCPPCNPGYYSNNPGSTECSVCNAGTISNAGPNQPGSTGCSPCSAGSYSFSGWSACQPCDSGYYSNATTGYEQCTAAIPGYYVGTVQTGQTFQYPCPYGSYSDTSGASSCTLCPFNQSTYDIGSTSSSDCVECPYGVNASTYACSDETSNSLDNICWDASQLLSLDASSAVQDLYDLVFNLQDVGVNALINETMNVIQGAADGTSTIEDIETVLDKLYNAPQNWLENLSNNLDSCVQSVSNKIYEEAETDLYNNLNLFQYQFGDDSQDRIEWMANWICSGATFGCAAFDQPACPQAHTCFAPLYQYFASFLSYSGGSAFGNYQNLNTGRNTPMYSPAFISSQLESTVESLVNWNNAYKSFQIYLNAMDQIKDGFSTFSADAFDATLQVQSVSTSVSQQSSYTEGNLYYKQAEYNFNRTYGMSEIVQYGAAWCPSGYSITAEGIPNECTDLKTLVKECEREMEFDAIMHIIVETAKLAAILVGDPVDVGGVEDIDGLGDGAGKDIIDIPDDSAGGVDGTESALGSIADDTGDGTESALGSIADDTGDGTESALGSVADETGDGTGSALGSVADDTGDGTGSALGSVADDTGDGTGSALGSVADDTGDGTGSELGSVADDTGTGDGTGSSAGGSVADDTSKTENNSKKKKEKSNAAQLFAKSYHVIGQLPPTSAAFLQESSIPKDVSWDPNTQLPPPPTTNANGAFENPEYADESYQWYVDGQKGLSSSLIAMSPARWDSIYLENEQQCGPTLLNPPNCQKYSSKISTALNDYLANVKSMSNYGSAMTSAAMALVPAMGNIAVAIATQEAIANANEEISGRVHKPDPAITTAPSSYQNVSNTLFNHQYKTTSNKILSYSPAASLMQQQYTAGKSIFEFCTSYAYMNGGQRTPSACVTTLTILVHEPVGYRTF